MQFTETANNSYDPQIKFEGLELLARDIEWANRDKAFGVDASKEDLYFGGCDFGFEIHGNYDCTVEVRNVDIIPYKSIDSAKIQVKLAIINKNADKMIKNAY